MATAFDNQYVQGTRYIFDLFTSRMAGKFSFSSDPQVDYENFPMLEQPIFVWVPDTHPYATILNPRLEEHEYVGAVKVSVNEVPKPLKPYNNLQSPVIFWNWPDSTPTSFSALLVRCSPLILPQITKRNYDMIGRGYLLDEALHPVVASDKSNYLGLLGPHIDWYFSIPIAYVIPTSAPLSVGSNYAYYYGKRTIAAQYLDPNLEMTQTPNIGEAAPTIGYWMAFLPVSCDQAMFEYSLTCGNLCCEEEEEDEEGE